MVQKFFSWWAVNYAQLVERSLPTPEVIGSNQVTGEFLSRTFVTPLTTVSKSQKT